MEDCMTNPMYLLESQSPLIDVREGEKTFSRVCILVWAKACGTPLEIDEVSDDGLYRTERWNVLTQTSSYSC